MFNQLLVIRIANIPHMKKWSSVRGRYICSERPLISKATSHSARSRGTPTAVASINLTREGDNEFNSFFTHAHALGCERCFQAFFKVMRCLVCAVSGVPFRRYFGWGLNLCFGKKNTIHLTSKPAHKFSCIFMRIMGRILAEKPLGIATILEPRL